MKVNSGTNNNNTSQHYKTSSNSSSHDASLITGLHGIGGNSTISGFAKMKSKHIIKSFDSRGGPPNAGTGAGGASSSNKSANVQSFGGGGHGTTGGGSGAGAGLGAHKRYKSSAGSSNCHSSFSNERSKWVKQEILIFLQQIYKQFVSS